MIFSNALRTLRAFGFYVRHARSITMRDVVLSTMTSDRRPLMVLQDVRTMLLDHVEARREDAAPFAVMRDVSDLTVLNVAGVADGRHAHIAAGALPEPRR